METMKIMGREYPVLDAVTVNGCCVPLACMRKRQRQRPPSAL